MKVRLRAVSVALALSVLAAPLAAEAQQTPAKVPRIGFLSPLSRTDDAVLEPFRQGLRELGYVEGRTIAVEYGFAEGRPERLPALAAELVRLKVDIIVTSSPPAPLAAKQATSSIPIVFTIIGDPVAEGFVASLARPGGNITGLATIAPELMGKQLELLKEVVPKVSRVAVLQNPSNHGHPPQLRQAEGAARVLGVQLHVVQAGSPAEIDEFMNQEANRQRIASFAAKNRLPTVAALRSFADAGALLSYGPNLDGMFRRAAYYVDRILKGAKPADLPVEQPTKFDLVINLKSAKALGLTIPPSLLQRADEVIQ